MIPYFLENGNVAQSPRPPDGPYDSATRALPYVDCPASTPTVQSWSRWVWSEEAGIAKVWRQTNKIWMKVCWVRMVGWNFGSQSCLQEIDLTSKAYWWQQNCLQGLQINLNCYLWATPILHFNVSEIVAVKCTRSWSIEGNVTSFVVYCEIDRVSQILPRHSVLASRVVGISKAAAAAMVMKLYGQGNIYNVQRAILPLFEVEVRTLQLLASTAINSSSSFDNLTSIAV